jgi:hypothetical protein
LAWFWCSQSWDLSGKNIKLEFAKVRLLFPVFELFFWVFDSVWLPGRLKENRKQKKVEVFSLLYLVIPLIAVAILR